MNGNIQAALQNLELTLEGLQGKVPLPVDLSGLEHCEQLKSMVRRACGHTLRQVEDMLLGDLWGLWSNLSDPDTDIPHPQGYGEHESAMWRKYVQRTTPCPLAEMLEDHVGNCMSWGFSSALVLKATGLATEVSICYGSGHIWVEALLPTGKNRVVDLSVRSHGGRPRRHRKEGAITL